MSGLRLPDTEHWRDDGCEFSPTCLSCPLPRCKFEMQPKEASSYLREVRLRELLAAGHSPNAAAGIMGVSRRQIFRLKRFRLIQIYDSPAAVS